nr:FAD-dependent oxidoreductase [Secundilactobacillus kimchicus]
MQLAKNIVVVGAGFAGVYATKKLAKRFKSNPDVTITLIDRHSYFTYLTQLHEVATERVQPDAVKYDLERLFHHAKNVQLVTDNVTAIDKENKQVHGEHSTYDFDSLIISMGGEPNDFGTPGVKENGFTLWSMEDAIALRDHIGDVIRRGAAEQDPEKRKALLTLVVCGSGFTGAETVGELIEYREVLAKENRLDPSEIKVILVEAAPTIINMLDRTNAGHAENFLKKNDIEIRTSSMITQVNPDTVEIKDQSPIATNTLIWTAGVKTNHTADEFGIEAGRGGRLITNKYLQAQGFKDKSIYVAGDDANATEEGAERAVPQTAQEAEQEALIVAHNVAEDINGATNYKEFKDKNMGFTVSFGSKYGIAQVFGGKRFRGRFATLMKHGSNLLYFMRIASMYYTWKYFMDEFFNVENGRTVFGYNTSRRSNVLWSLPLRLYFGIALFIDGLAKMNGDSSWLVMGHPGFGIWELILGCLIFFGLATWCANFIVIICFFIFLHSWATVWVLFVAFALMNGSGRSFGLDLWFVPWLQKTLGKWRYGTQRSIYRK